MNSRTRNRLLLVLLLPATVVAWTATFSQESRRSSTSLAIGLDHIPVAVTDLDVAAERYRQLAAAIDGAVE